MPPGEGAYFVRVQDLHHRGETCIYYWRRRTPPDFKPISTPTN